MDKNVNKNMGKHLDKDVFVNRDRDVDRDMYKDEKYIFKVRRKNSIVNMEQQYE